VPCELLDKDQPCIFVVLDGLLCALPCSRAEAHSAIKRRMSSLGGLPPKSSFRDLGDLLTSGTKPLWDPTPRPRPEPAERPQISRMVLVSNHLPLHCKRGDSGKWEFEWDQDALLHQVNLGLAGVQDQKWKVLHVGSLSVDIPEEELDEVANHLLEHFNCAVVNLGPELKNNYYRGFCKQYLWPIFHYQLPLGDAGPLSYFDKNMWTAYLSANKKYADKVMEVLSPATDLVWAHDYHLLVFPSLLRRRCNQVRCGYFLHCAFPSSEIYRTIPVRGE